jgi:glutamate/tyrosine decarboxylase-like PLP-dependent enzyme
MDTKFELGLAAMAQAAEYAIQYRRSTTRAERTPVANYQDIFDVFHSALPEFGGDPRSIIQKLVEKATPGIRASTGPRFFGWVIGNSHPTGVAADWLASAWGQNAGNTLAAPAASAVEAVAAGWLLDLLDLPRESSIGFVTGATVANFVCLAAARSEVLRRIGWDVEADGLFGAPPVNVIIGADAHATVFSAIKYLGLGARRVQVIESDSGGRMDARAFEQAMKNGKGPTIAIAQAGQINTGVSDPFEPLSACVVDHNGWLHIDGAFGLWARACPSRASLVSGVERADSWATDGHKWLQVPYDCGYAIVRDPEAHRRAMAISASYLPPAQGAERDPSAYVPELSRRARGFATWAMIRQLGRTGIAEMIEQCCEVAAQMAARLSAEPGITLVHAVELNQFMLVFGEGDIANTDRQTLAVIAQVQADAVAFIGAAQWRGRWVMRVSVCSIETSFEEAEKAAAAVLEAWRRVSAR